MIKKSWLAAGLLLLALSPVAVSAQSSTEKIRDFQSKIVIQQDGLTVVEESITYDFGSNQRHGIFRDIPTKASDGHQIGVVVLGVTNQSGNPYLYETTNNSNKTQIKIGDPNTLISGIKTYLIKYQVYNAIRTFDDHDELYWNVTGNDWNVAMEKVSATVFWPDTEAKQLKFSCYTGTKGSKAQACFFNTGDQNTKFATVTPLQVGEGLTVVAGLPKGLVQNSATPPTDVSIFDLGVKSVLSTIAIALSVLWIVVVAPLFAWLVRTRRYKNVGVPYKLKHLPVIVEYGPPANLNPIEASTLLHRRFNYTDLSSAIIDLAVRGYLKIKFHVYDPQKSTTKGELEFIKLKDGVDLVSLVDRQVFAYLFNGSDTVLVSALNDDRKTNYPGVSLFGMVKTAVVLLKSSSSTRTFILEMKRLVEAELKTKGYASWVLGDKTHVIDNIFYTFTVIWFLVSYILIRLDSGWVIVTSLLLIITIISQAIFDIGPQFKITELGMSTSAKLLGFKDFLNLTEKDKLALTNAPALTPEVFDKFLPYAMVLGVEKQWAKQFAGIYTTAPSWYENPAMVAFNMDQLLTSFNDFDKSWSSNTASVSGLDGGGSSGGGSGGGGGGSW